MTLRKATVRKEGDEWVAEYETDAIPAIEGKSTKNHPEIKVDIGMKLEPMRVHYPSDKFSLEQVLESTKDRLEEKECEMCDREQKVVAAFVGGLYQIKEERLRLQQQKATTQIPKLKEKPKSFWPLLPRPSIVAELMEESKKGN